MDQSHGIVNEERLVLFSIDEIQNKVAEIIGAKILLATLDDFPILVDLRFVESAGLFAFVKPCPHAVLIEAVFNRLIRVLVKLAELPLASNRR